MKRDEMVFADESMCDLSTDERALCGAAPPITNDAIELSETLLYYHLDCARRARMRMDRMKTWNRNYMDEFRARELALAGASRHYLLLQAAGTPIPRLLATMFLAEGLRP